MAGEKSLDIYFIRHGECLANLVQAEIIGGRSSNNPLSDSGRIQACKLGIYLAGEEVHFDEVYSSPAIRTIATAKLACHYISYPLERIVVCDELQELSQGDWEEKPRAEFYTPEAIAQMDADHWNFKAPNGESQRDTEERMLGWVKDKLLPRYEQGLTVGVFTHGLAIKCLFRGIMQSHPERTYKIEIDNASITRARYARNGWHLISLNSTPHLDGMKSKPSPYF